MKYVCVVTKQPKPSMISTGKYKPLITKAPHKKQKDILNNYIQFNTISSLVESKPKARPKPTSKPR